jgi:hypothetical protein
VILFVLLIKVPHLTLFPVISLGIGIALLPVVLPSLNSLRVTAFLGGVTLLALLSGIVSIVATSADFGTRGGTLTILTLVAWLLAIPATTAIAMWASREVGLLTSLRLVVAGGLVNAVINELPHTWKGSLGIYATVLALLVCARGSRWLSRCLLLASAFVSSVSDARFMAIIAILVFIVSFAGSKFAARMRRHPIRWAIGIVVFFALALRVVISAMLAGWLGSAIQERTQYQLGSGHSIVEAGRTEWAATLYLFSTHPFGFGIGESINRGVARTAIDHVQAVGGDYLSNYLPDEVFGSRVDLHSMLADLWYHFGLGGILMAAVVAFILVFALPHAARLATSLGAGPMFMILVGLWDLFFSPMGNSDRLMAGILVAGLLFLDAKYGTNVYHRGVDELHRVTQGSANPQLRVGRAAAHGLARRASSSS